MVASTTVVVCCLTKEQQLANSLLRGISPYQSIHNWPRPSLRPLPAWV